MSYLYIFTGITLLLSLIANRVKTKKALKIAAKKLLNILPSFVQMLILVSVLLFLIPDHIIAKYLGESSNLTATVLGLIFGSITMMPGFIVFPLGGILLSKGVSYMTIAAFSTTLMNVGIITYPVEKQYFGVKLTILRNLISFVIAVIITLVIGIIYGEVF
ncbi:MAG: permease [Halanaerobiales bacterium]|nr:permease [Halanaerobiales bacterium]